MIPYFITFKSYNNDKMSESFKALKDEGNKKVSCSPALCGTVQNSVVVNLYFPPFFIDNQKEITVLLLMKLPNKEKAFIQPSKLIDYLLSEIHPVGKTKADFLRSYGFNNKNLNILEQGLIDTAQAQDVKEVVTSLHGTKYVIDGEIKTPQGDIIMMRTVWIIDKGEENPRFVTAYPV